MTRVETITKEITFKAPDFKKYFYTAGMRARKYIHDVKMTEDILMKHPYGRHYCRVAGHRARTTGYSYMTSLIQQINYLRLRGEL